VGIWVVVCAQKPTHRFLQTFRPLRMLKIVFRDSWFYPKQLSLFCLLWLNSAGADRIGYITNFCSMIKLLRSSKTAVVKVGAFRHLIMSQQGKVKFCWTSIHNNKSNVYLRTLCAFSILV